MPCDGIADEDGIVGAALREAEKTIAGADEGGEVAGGDCELG